MSDAKEGRFGRQRTDGPSGPSLPPSATIATARCYDAPNSDRPPNPIRRNTQRDHLGTDGPPGHPLHSVIRKQVNL
jgi:hypothetical protein